MSAKVFIDSNIWLYALVTNPAEANKHRTARELIDTCGRCVVSSQVVAEVSVNLLKKAGFTEEALMRVVADFYLSHSVHETDLACHRRASALRAAYSISYWDSLIAAAAYEAECRICYSEDMQHGLLIDGRLRISNPFSEPRTIIT